jgi:RNA polymerase sigma factor (sigma-70 family)
LAAHDREVLVMLYLEQMSINEIAATLEMTESGVKSRHRRALLKLTHILQDARQGPP